MIISRFESCQVFLLCEEVVCTTVFKSWQGVYPSIKQSSMVCIVTLTFEEMHNFRPDRRLEERDTAGDTTDD